MSTLQALIPFLSHELKLVNSGARQQKALVQLRTVSQGWKVQVLLQPQDRFGKSVICHDQSEVR